LLPLGEPVHSRLSAGSVALDVIQDGPDGSFEIPDSASEANGLPAQRDEHDDEDHETCGAHDDSDSDDHQIFRISGGSGSSRATTRMR
jgi:hypothetical protein